MQRTRVIKVLRSELIYITLIAAICVLLSTLSPKLINILYSLLITTFSFGCFYILYIIRSHPQQSKSNALNSVLSKLLVASFLFSISLFMVWLSYKFILDPFSIACKYNSGCETGPLSWSVSLLLLGASALTFYISFILIKSAMKKASHIKKKFHR